MNKYQRYARVAQLPPIPPSIRPLPYSNDENRVRAVVLGGLSLIGVKGYFCPTVSIISTDVNSGEMFGWSLCLGSPDSQPEDGPYYFRTSEQEGVGTAKGTEIPNTMVYFEAEVDADLVSQEADPHKLDAVIAYVLPYISDNGPPPAEGKTFDELVAEVPTSDTELKEALVLRRKISSLLGRAALELTGDLGEMTLFDELNRRLHESEVNHAWKSYPSKPDYNPELGIVEMQVAGRLVTVSIGLSKDRFAGPCAVVQIIDRS